MKRLFDIIVSFLGLVVVSPVLFIFGLLIFVQDFHSPIYVSPRVGHMGKIFRLFKLRSMVVNADKCGVDSTSSDDPRITWSGQIVRRYKLDELPQLWNVFIGQMSLVGPRPQVKRAVDSYTKEEHRLVAIRPGLTDLSSIVFYDEGEILSGAEDPDLKYEQIIRPWKSRLGLLYIGERSFLLDLKIICLTTVAILSRDLALAGIQRILRGMDVEPQLISVVARKEPLKPYPPPGSSKIIMHSNAE